MSVLRSCRTVASDFGVVAGQSAECRDRHDACGMGYGLPGAVPPVIETSRTPSAGFLVLSLLCVAGGTLTKWTAPAFLYLTVIPLLIWRGELRLLFGWRHLLAVGVAMGVPALGDCGCPASGLGILDRD